MKTIRIIIFCLLLLLFLPLFLVAFSSYVSTIAGCTLHEGFVNPCIIFGSDWGATLYALGMIGWILIVTIPIATLIVIGWVIFELTRFVIIFSRKNTNRDQKTLDN